MIEKLSVLTLEAPAAASAFDYVIDGHALRPTLSTQDISMLNQWTGIETAQQLLLDIPLDVRLNGRVQIYGCCECVDFYCGGIAVHVTKIGDRMHWSNPERFGIDWGSAGYHSPIMFERINVGPFAFDLAKYTAALREFLKHFRKEE